MISQTYCISSNVFSGASRGPLGTSTARSYSSLIGSIDHKDNKIRILIPRGLEAADQFSMQMQKHRESALNIAEMAILRKQLDKQQRELVYDGDPQKSPYTDERKAPLFDMHWGNTMKQVKLTPRKFKGRLGKKILHIIAYTSQTPNEVRESSNVVQECLGSPSLRKNMDKSVLSIISRKAAANGIYGEIFERIMSPDTVFKKHCTDAFYLEALRIEASRTPYHSQTHPNTVLVNKSCANLWELYLRSEKGPARGMCLAYALAIINRRMVALRNEIKSELIKVITEVEEIGLKLHPMRSDLLLYHEALRSSKLDQFEPARRRIESILSKSSHNRESLIHYCVDISDLKAGHGSSNQRWGSYNKRFAFFDRNINKIRRDTSDTEKVPIPSEN